MIKVVLFTETNSIFGYRFIEKFLTDSEVELQAVVVRAAGIRCSYYINDPEQIDNATYAQSHGVEVLRPESANDRDLIRRLKELQPDYLIVANYQLKISAEVLSVPTYDAINFHPSPLPKYAGLAPFYWMWANKEEQAGVSAIIMDESFDGGKIIAQHLFKLEPDMDSLAIRALTFERSWKLLDLVLPTLIDHSYLGVAQDLSLRSYFGAPPNEVNANES